MDFITGTLLSGFIYDMLKHQLSLTADNIKKRLQDWVVDDSVANAIEKELCKLQLSDELSESAIEKRIGASGELTTLMTAIKPNLNTTIVQSHSGTGDNIAGDKTTNY